MTVLIKIWRWIKRVLNVPQTVEPISVEEVPETPEPYKIYLVGDTEQPWSAALLCPCGCAALIELSLVLNDDPRWRITRSADNIISLHPSIWRIKGCRSHFFIRNNRIIWAGERQR